MASAWVQKNTTTKNYDNNYNNYSKYCEWCDMNNHSTEECGVKKGTNNRSQSRGKNFSINKIFSNNLIIKIIIIIVILINLKL